MNSNEIINITQIHNALKENLPDGAEEVSFQFRYDKSEFGTNSLSAEIYWNDNEDSEEASA